MEDGVYPTVTYLFHSLSVFSKLKLNRNIFNSPVSFSSKINGVVSTDWSGFSRAVGFVAGFTMSTSFTILKTEKGANFLYLETAIINFTFSTTFSILKTIKGRKKNHPEKEMIAFTTSSTWKTLKNNHKFPGHMPVVVFGNSFGLIWIIFSSCVQFSGALGIQLNRFARSGYLYLWSPADNYNQNYDRSRRRRDESKWMERFLK